MDAPLELPKNDDEKDDDDDDDDEKDDKKDVNAFLAKIKSAA